MRRVGRNELDYIGQTGRNLRERLGALSRCYNDEMPYRDPHTAAPALWALRHSSGCEFEASVYPLDVDAPTRKGREALEIALYRQQCGNSPTVQFGRVPLGYRASSQNNSRLVAAGARFRGGAYSGPPLAEHHVGTGPKGRLSPAPQTESWCGHSWSAWLPLHEVGSNFAQVTVGLYRIRGDSGGELLYVGQGALPNRPRAHLAKIAKADHAQGAILAMQKSLEVSWVATPELASHQLLELENDLIAAHVLHMGSAPAAQFIG
ncbi:GIY-YIG nuclease family protein [Rhodococcus phenolicus]|uniref:GIY-YIG nuclease family protein n=1 Tax=Rhodococcus phenolicus TaxID=263849 RepID=UPI0012E8281C|nr:GIY-YIG nuclease family protein [Rhodococcus phenolicus]